MNLLQVALRALIAVAVGTGLFHVIGPVFQFSSLTCGIIGAIWTLICLPWIWFPAFRGN